MKKGSSADWGSWGLPGASGSTTGVLLALVEALRVAGGGIRSVEMMALSCSWMRITRLALFPLLHRTFRAVVSSVRRLRTWISLAFLPLASARRRCHFPRSLTRAQTRQRSGAGSGLISPASDGGRRRTFSEVDGGGKATEQNAQLNWAGLFFTCRSSQRDSDSAVHSLLLLVLLLLRSS